MRIGRAPFELLPAVDIAGGRVARAESGIDHEGRFVDPIDLARRFEAGGAEWIHLVDLDAAFGRGSNAALLAAVVGSLDVDVEVSGGICDDASLAAALATGCRRVVLGTSAVADLAWCTRVISQHGDRVAVSLDVQVDGGPDTSPRHRLVARGGNADVGDLWETIGALDAGGCARYVVTEASRDGTLRGPDVEWYRQVLQAAPAPVIASGGIGSVGDLVDLAAISVEGERLEGAVVGRALLAGRFTLAEAQRAVRRADGPG